MKRTFFFSLALIAVFILPLHAQLKAVVKEFSGKVEIKLPDKDWAPAVADMEISKGSMISTGFGSRLVIEIGMTQVTVSPLTRMLLDDVVKRESTNSTSLTLKVGKVNAKVKSAEGEHSEFVLKGPASTAGVRGTEFNFDGYRLQVIEGVVQFFNLLAQARDVHPGESSVTDGNSTPGGGEEGDQQDSLVLGATGGGLLGGGEGSGGGGLTPTITTGTVAVTIYQ